MLFRCHMQPLWTEMRLTPHRGDAEAKDLPVDSCLFPSSSHTTYWGYHLCRWVMTHPVWHTNTQTLPHTHLFTHSQTRRLAQFYQIKTNFKQPNSPCVGCRCVGEVGRAEKAPSSSSPSVSLHVTVMSQHCSTWLGVCVTMRDWHSTSPRGRFQQAHTCCLWRRLLHLGLVQGTDVVARVFVFVCVCTLRVLSRVLRYSPSPGMGLMGREEKADEAGPEAAYDVSNTWSVMSPGGHIGRVPGPSASASNCSECTWGTARVASLTANS